MDTINTKPITFPFKIQKTTIPRPSYSKSGSWGTKQTIRFVVFICYFDYLFDGTYNKRPIRVFNFLSEFMKTRTVKQCRSHHQKLFDNGKKKVSQMMKQFQNMIGRQSFQYWTEFYTEEMQEIHKRIFDRFQGKQKSEISPKQAQQLQFLNKNPQQINSEKSISKRSWKIEKSSVSQNPCIQESVIKHEDKENHKWIKAQILLNGGFQNLFKMHQEENLKNYDQKKQYKVTGPTNTGYQEDEYDQNEAQNQIFYSVNPLMQNQVFYPTMQMNNSHNQFFNAQQQILIDNSFVNQQIWRRQNQIQRIIAVRQCNHNLQMWMKSVLKLEDLCKYK